MKYLKMLALTAIAVMGLMASLAAGTASATVLCEDTVAAGTDCGASGSGTTPVAEKKEIDLTMKNETSLLMTGPFGEVLTKCTSLGTMNGNTGSAGAGAGSTFETVLINIFELTFVGCSHPVTVKTAGNLEIHHITGSDNGTLTSNGLTVTIHEVPAFGSCSYSTNKTDLGILTGTSVTGGPPVLDISTTLSSENCANATLTATYKYSGATNFNVAAG
jgi:hypothetical protein